MKLCHAVLLILGLKGVKIAQKVTKVGVHGYLSNRDPNLCSNFNSEKLVRSETSSFIFARVGLEGVQIARTIAKVGVHVFISNGHPNLLSNFNSDNLVKSETPSFNSLTLGLKEGKMALRKWKQMQPFSAWFHQVCLRAKITQNPLKVCMHGYLSNGYLNSLSNFNYKKAEKITSLRPLLGQP